MSLDNYNKAKKMAQRAYNAALQKHRDPYLPVLAELVPELDRLQHVQVGIVQIPLDLVVGTERRGRSYAFAANFMPLLQEDSEFANKWNILCESVIENGLKQPVTAAEYMGEYYLIEGNKRVSVMNYLDALYIEADVLRYYPPRTDDPAVVAYYESLEFQRVTRLNMIRLTEPEAYHRLCQICGYEWGENWSEDDIVELRAIYQYFYMNYRELFGRENARSVGDAFLTYLKAYGFAVSKKKSSEDIKNDIRLMKSEYERRENGEGVTLIMDRVPSAPGLFTSLFTPQKVKAAFLYTRPPEESGWNYRHELGRLGVEQLLGDRVQTEACIIPSRDAFEPTVERLIKEGTRIIFATSPVMLNSCIRPSMEHPDVKLLCCSLLASYYHVPSYYLRFYESKFLIGMLAGLSTQTGKVGYIADYPIHGTPSAINAFAIGARMVRTDVRVYLSWSTELSFDPAHPFADPDVDVISNRDINAPKHSSMEYGLYSVNGGIIRNLAAPLPDWTRFYQHEIESLLNGAFEQSRRDHAALNYWWGLSSGALDVMLSTHTDPYLARLIDAFRRQIVDGTFHPFVGEIRDQAGNVRCNAYQQLTPAEILCMDYLVEQVDGHLPDVNDLQETARPIVRLQGLNGELKPDPASIRWRFQHENGGVER